MNDEAHRLMLLLVHAAGGRVVLTPRDAIGISRKVLIRRDLIENDSIELRISRTDLLDLPTAPE